jgi:hypothetical protein
MKTKFFLSLFMLTATSALLFLNSCSSLKTLSINKNYENIDFLIQAPQAAGVITIEEEVETDLQALASSNGFDISKIESATVNSITLNIVDTDPIPVTYDIIDNIVCSFMADGITVAEVGNNQAVMTSPTQMNFDLKGIDVAPYMKASKFKVIMKITTNAAITHDVPMKASIDCVFKVKPFK